MSRKFLIILMFLVCVPACAAKMPTSHKPIGKPEMKLTSGNSGIFDLQTMDFIANHAGIVALNVPLEGHPDGAPSFAAIVARLHAVNPELPVLMYAHGTLWTNSGHTIGHTLGIGYEHLGSGLLPSKYRENPRSINNRALYYGNPANESFRKWVIGRVKHYLDVTGADGVNMDNMFRTPGWLRKYCKRQKPICNAYQGGMQKYLMEMQKAIAPKLVFFNGLWNAWPGLLATQMKLLPFADGAFIEFFGRRKNKPIPPFSHGIAPYLEIIAANPEKRFLVNGRGTKVKYRSYEADYLWQRYLYAAYLLVAGPRTHFHYNVMFTVPSLGRASGMAWYADWDIPLGVPLGPYSNQSGLYSRRFADALVLLVPADAGHAEKYRLQGEWYTPEGTMVSDNLTVEPGEAYLLTRNRRESKPITIAFSGKKPVGTNWQGASIEKALGSGSYLALKELPAAEAWRHDLMLDFNHSLAAPGCVDLRLRSEDKSLRFLLVAAVNDAKSMAERVVIEFSAGGGNARHGRMPAVWFRDARSHNRRMPYLEAHTSLPVDGKWHETSLCADAVFSDQSRYSFAQWKYVRILGAVDIDSIQLKRSVGE